MCSLASLLSLCRRAKAAALSTSSLDHSAAGYNARTFDEHGKKQARPKIEVSRVEAPSAGLIQGYPYAAPCEDMKLK